MMAALRLSIMERVAAVFGINRAAQIAQGWRDVAQDPELVMDLSHLGHLFEDPLYDPESGDMFTDHELRVRAARKALVLQILARAEITRDELNDIRKLGETGNEISFDDDGVLGAFDGVGTE